MKIAYNPKTAAVITTATAANNDILFDLNARKVWAKGLRMGADWADISSKPSSLKNPAALTTFGVVYDGSVAKTVTTSTFISQVNEGTSTVTDGTMLITSYASNNGFSDTNAVNIPYKRKASHLWDYIKTKTDALYSAIGHNHDGRYLKLTGGTMASNALITFADSGSQGTGKGPQGARGGLYWSGQSDYAKLYAEETAGDNLDLVIQFGDDNSNGLSIRNRSNVQTSYISAGGVITTGTFKGNLDWSYITNKPNTFTPSAHEHTYILDIGNNKHTTFAYSKVGLTAQATEQLAAWNGYELRAIHKSQLAGMHTHAWNSLTHSSTTANQAILTNGSANGWKLYTLNISAWDNAASKAHSHANKSVLDGITSGLISNWNTAYTFVHTITGTDTDKVINKWDEIVNFLAGITEDNKLNTLLNSKLSIQQLSAKDILITKTNNALFWVNTVGTASSITTGPFTDHPYALLSVTNYSQNDTNGKFFYRSRLAFSSAGDIKVASCHHQDEYKQDETWYNVLTSKNSGISGSTIKLNGTSITVYSSGTADGRYVKKSGDTMSGALNFANGTWNKVGDDIYMGDHNIGGQLCLMGITGNTGISFHKQGDASIRKSITFNGNTLYMNGNCDYASLANQSNLLAMNTVPNKTTSTSVGSWSPISGRYVFHQRWNDTSIGSDSADFGIYLDGNLTANMVLDGYYNSLLGFRVIRATGGFLKANGTIDHNTYLTSHQSLSNYYTKGEINTKLNNYLPLSGGTMKGQISSTYSVGTWIRGCTNAIIKAVADGYNSLICAPIKSGNVCISTWTAEDNLNFGYAKKGKTKNAFDTRMYWDAPNNNLHAGAFTGHLYGTADNATKLTTSRIIWGQSFDGTHDITGVMTINPPTISNGADNTIMFQVYSSTSYKNGLGISSTDNVTRLYAKPFGSGMYNSLEIHTYNKIDVKAVTINANGSVYASNTVTSAGFKHSAVTKNANQYVLTADGGYTFLNQVSNELAHEFSKNITVTSEWTDIEDFYGGNQSFLTQPGTYIVQVYYKDASADGMYEGYFSGIMSWYTGKTNSNNADEIVLHRVGHAYANTIYLRTRESLSSEANPYTKLQISANSDLKQHTYKFKFKRIC